MLHLKMLISKLTDVSSTEARFHRKNIRYAKLSPHTDARGLFFRFMNKKPAWLETKVVADFTHQIRKHTGLMGKLLIIVSVHKNVFLATVTMQIQVKYDFTLFLKRPD